jgi:hypothetical protein
MTSRIQGIVMAVLSLTAFTVGLASVCLPDVAHSPVYYDGDEDDAGLVQEPHLLASGIGIVQPVAHLPPPQPFHSEVVDRTDARRDAIASRGSGSRAPPAPPRSIS